MKKEKSKIIFSIFGTITTLLLIGNLYFNNKYFSCNLEKDKLSNDKVIKSIDVVNDFQHLSMSTLLGVSSKSINIALDEKGNISMAGNNEEGKNFMENTFWHILKNASATAETIKGLDENISNKKIECNKYSIWSAITLYAALLMSFVSLVYGTLIYKLYKT